MGHSAEMDRGAKEHSNIATAYEKLTASAPPELRSVFARKANRHSILARIAAEIEKHPAEKEKVPGGQRAGLVTEPQSEAFLFSPSRLWDARRKTEVALAKADAP